jgi:hypothetical protein
VSIDQGIGPVEESGSRPVNPSQTTTYTLTARGQGGDEKKKLATVTIRPVESTSTTPLPDRQCIDRYEFAYQLKSIDELVKVWPSLAGNSRVKNALKDSFKGAQAIVLQHRCDPPSVSADLAHYQCSETMTYTIDGKAQKPQTNPVEFVCRKTPTGWVVESRNAK